MFKNKNKNLFNPLPLMRRAVFKAAEVMEMDEENIEGKPESVRDVVRNTNIQLVDEVLAFGDTERGIDTGLYENSDRFADRAISNVQMFATKAIKKIKSMKGVKGDLPKQKALEKILYQKKHFLGEIEEIKFRYLCRRKIVKAEALLAITNDYIKDKRDYDETQIQGLYDAADLLDKTSDEVNAMKASGMEKKKAGVISKLQAQAKKLRVKAEREALGVYKKELDALVAPQEKLIASVEEKLDQGETLTSSDVAAIADYQKNLQRMKDKIMENYPSELALLENINSRITQISELTHEIEVTKQVADMLKELKKTYENLQKARKDYDSKKSRANYSWLTGAEKAHYAQVTAYQKLLTNNNIDLSKAAGKAYAKAEPGGPTRHAAYMVITKESKEFDPDMILSRLKKSEAKNLYQLKETAEKGKNPKAWQEYVKEYKKLAKANGITVPVDHLKTPSWRVYSNKRFKESLTPKELDDLAFARKYAVKKTKKDRDKYWKYYVYEVKRLSKKYGMDPPERVFSPWEIEKLKKKWKKEEKKAKSPAQLAAARKKSATKIPPKKTG